MKNRSVYLVSATPPQDDDVMHLPLLETRWLRPPVDLARYDGIILTSKNAIEALERIAPAWKALPVVCVGKATERRAAETGATVLAACGGYGDELYDLIRTGYKEKRWLYARPKAVASDFASRLRGEGIAVEETVVYETVCRADTLTENVDDDAVLIFTSPSAVHCFLSRFALTPAHTVVVIGRTTGKSLPRTPVHIAPEPTLASCISLAKQLRKESI